MSKKFNGKPGRGAEFSSAHFQRNQQFSRNLEQKATKNFDRTQGKESFRIEKNAGGAVETFKQYNAVMQTLSPFERGVANTFFKEGVSPGQAREKLSRSRISEAGKNRIEFVLLLALAILVFLTACGVPMTELPETLSPPTATSPATETMSADESTPAAVTEAATEAATEAPDFDASYFTYDEEVEQHQTEAESLLERNWALIYEKIIRAGIAVNFEVTCITGNNFCIKPNDGYPPGTYFVISDIPGFEGQVLTVTTTRASEIAGVPVVEITLGANGNPVGLDAAGNVVVFVNESGAWEKGTIALAGDLVDDLETEQEQLTIEQINENVGHSVHITKNFKGVDYNIYWSPTRGQWRSDHNTPIEELDLTGDSFAELVAGPDAVTLEKINLPGLGEKTLAEIYRMSDAELKKYIIELIKEAMKAKNPNVTAEKLKQIEDYYNTKNFLPVVIDPNSEQSDIYTEWYSPAQGPKASIPEASVTFHDGTPTNILLMPILNNSGEIICFVRIYQTTKLSTAVTEFSINGAFNTGGYQIEDAHSFGNTSGDSFAFLAFDTGAPYEDISTGPILQGEEGIGDANTIKKLKSAHSLEEVMAILEEIRLIAIKTTDSVVERN